MKEIIKLIKEVEVKVTPEGATECCRSNGASLVNQAICYNKHAEYVFAKLDELGKFIPISPFYVADVPDVGLVSESVWAKHLSPMLLPKTDVIWLAPYKARTATISVSWHIAESVCSGMLNPIGSTPELYLVTEFPSKAQLKIIKNIQAL